MKKSMAYILATLSCVIIFAIGVFISSFVDWDNLNEQFTFLIPFSIIMSMIVVWYKIVGLLSKERETDEDEENSNQKN